MTQSTAIIATENASRYLQQLCKHWAHRFDVTFDSLQGHIVFSADESLGLAATDSALTLILSVAQDSDSKQMQQVVTEHLERFAFRETLIVQWSHG